MASTSPDAYPYYSPPNSPRHDAFSLSPAASASSDSLPWSDNQTTLTLLPTTLSLVNIPRQRAASGTVCHLILSHLLNSPSAVDFLAIVANELELSIFADAATVARTGFIKMAKREQKLAHKGTADARRRGWRPIEVSSQRWSVLQVDTHDDLEDAGRRIHQISSALAAASIPILFVSSHTADFILVRSSHLLSAIAFLRQEGFRLWDEEDLGNYLGPLGGSISGSWVEAFCNGEDVTFNPPEQAGTSPTASTHSGETVRAETVAAAAPYPVTALAGTVACIGLAEDSAPLWLVKIVQLLAFPHHILRGISASTDGTAKGKRRARSRQRGAWRIGDDRPPPPAAEDDRPASPYESDGSAGGSSSGSFDEDEREDSSFPSSLRSSPLSSPSPSPSSSQSSLHLHHSHAHPPSPSPSPHSSPHPHPAILALPFFSFVRTRGATSLTASTRVLSRLFGPDERWMVLSAGELDLPAPSLGLRCLQVDLSAFRLDKYGLANDISDALVRAGVNHLYTSTLRTANVLVPEEEVGVAMRALCGEADLEGED